VIGEVVQRVVTDGVGAQGKVLDRRRVCVESGPWANIRSRAEVGFEGQKLLLVGGVYVVLWSDREARVGDPVPFDVCAFGSPGAGDVFVAADRGGELDEAVRVVAVVGKIGCPDDPGADLEVGQECAEQVEVLRSPAFPGHGISASYAARCSSSHSHSTSFGVL